MQNSKQFLKNKEILPRISFKDGNPHFVKLLKDKVDKITDENGKEIEGVKYLVQENSENKSFFTSSIGLIQKLSEYKEGDEVQIQMKRKKGQDGKFKSYYEVSGQDIDDIPIVENPPEYEGE